MGYVYNTKPPLGDTVKLLDRFIEESIYETRACAEGITKVLTNPNFVSIMVYDGNVPVALLIGGVYKHPLFTDVVAQDLVNYVTPEYRGGLIARRLVQMLEAWAKSKSAKYLHLGQSTATGDITRVAEFYHKLGFRTTGFNTLKRV